MKQPPVTYRSGLVTRSTSKRATCATCGRDLGVRRFTSTGLDSTVAAALREWLAREDRCRRCVRAVVR